MSTVSTSATEFAFGLLRRIGAPDETDSRLEAIATADPDWNAIFDLVARHRLHSALRRTLDDLDVTLPPKFDQKLDTRYRENSLTNLDHARQLLELTDLFDANNIAALPYKGPVLAGVGYGSVGERSFGDLDFLVKKEDVEAACTLLEEHGYERLNFPDIPVATLVDGTPFRWGKEFRFKSEDSGLPVELRFGFIGGNRSDSRVISDFWTRRTPVELAGRSVSTLSPEDRALLLLVHGTKHGWRQLSWVYDIGKIREHDIDWDVVLRRAERYSWRNAVLYGLAATSKLTEQPVPDVIEAELKSSRFCSYGSSRTVACLRNQPWANLTHLEPITTAMFLNDSMFDVLADGLDEIFAPRKSDYERVLLPPPLYPLYYLIRLYTLFINTIKQLTSR